MIYPVSIYENLSAIKLSEEDFEKVVRKFWDKDNPLFQMPRNHIGENTIIIPSDTLPLFVDYNFEHQRVRRDGSS